MIGADPVEGVAGCDPAVHEALRDLAEKVIPTTYCTGL